MKYNPTLHRLSNGITVILDPMDLETTSVKVSFNTGSRDEAPHEYGITHFCEHMLCKGTSRLPSVREIEEYLEYYGGNHNASTGVSALSFYGRILAKNVNVLIEFIGDQLKNSLFDSDKIEIERRVICDELRRAKDNPLRQFDDFMSATLFGGATFSTRNLGNVENIMSFTREQMREFLARRLSAQNCIIGISGRIIDTESVLQCLEDSFNFLTTHDVPVNDVINYTPAIAHNTKSENHNIKLRILFPDICVSGYENRFNNMCVGRFERYMNKEISNVLRQDNGLVYGFSGFGVGNSDYYWNGFNTETSKDSIAKVVALIAKTAYKVYNKFSMTTDDLDRYQRKDYLGDADWLESSTRRCDKLISFYRTYGRIYDFYDTVKMFGNITVDDVFKNSRGYFDGQMSIITQGADFDADLKQVWIDNFREDKNVVKV